VIKKLKEISEQSYSPYSNFKVSAILEERNGDIHCGVNIENMAFPSSMCAERVAIGVARMNRANFKEIINVHIFSPNADFFLAPCGSCRQVLTEHLNIKTNIYMYSNNSEKKVMTLEELVPEAILPKSLEGEK
jgi:cytidine deaminase